MTIQKEQQNEQPSQVVLDELNEQDLAVVAAGAGGMMHLKITPSNVLTPEEVKNLNRYPYGIGPAVPISQPTGRVAH